MLGWLLLPVAFYPPEAFGGNSLTMEIIGIALPSRLLVTKALVVAVTVFVCLAVKAPERFQRFRPTMADIALALFCASPLLASMAGKTAFPQALIQVAYLTGVWGCTWMTGRLILSDEEGQRDLATAIVGSGLCLAIPAVVEGIRPAWLYTAIYGPHPFVFDGVGRYFGFRPLAFFEHGNQYGLWISLAALVAVHGALKRPRSTGRIAAAMVLVTCAVASQSVGAIMLLLAGCGFMAVTPRMRRSMLVAMALLSMTAGAAYLSGRVPLRSWAMETAAGQMASRALHVTQRASLGWRVQRDQKALQLIHRAPWVGHGTWDWWRPVETHPWGLPLLIAGQFGILALGAAALALLLAPLRAIWRGDDGVLPIVVGLAMLDSWLNSTIYIIAILAAAALTRPRTSSLANGASADGAIAREVRSHDEAVA